MERVVKITIHENDNNDYVKDPENESFRSKNHIPRQVRTQMRRKHEASKGLKTVTSVKRCLRLREKLENAENELKSMFMKKKIQDEAVAFAKMKRNPKVFFSLAKKK